MLPLLPAPALIVLVTLVPGPTRLKLKSVFATTNPSVVFSTIIL
jgi:hypothetical protein